MWNRTRTGGGHNRNRGKQARRAVDLQDREPLLSESWGCGGGHDAPVGNRKFSLSRREERKNVSLRPHNWRLRRVLRLVPRPVVRRDETTRSYGRWVAGRGIKGNRRLTRARGRAH